MKKRDFSYESVALIFLRSPGTRPIESINPLKYIVQPAQRDTGKN
jgi:hypothetical protein